MNLFGKYGKNRELQLAKVSPIRPHAPKTRAAKIIQFKHYHTDAPI